MTRKEILDELKKVIAPYTTNKEMLDSINDQTDLIRDLKINSANLVDIIIDAEAKYQIEIDYDSADKMINVGTCIDFKNIEVFKGRITFGSDILFSISIINPEFIVSIVNSSENFENIGWGIKVIENSDPNYQSIAVREFLIDKLRTVLQFDNLIIDKNQHGIPIVIIGGGEEITIPVSLSHHHLLVAYS